MNLSHKVIWVPKNIKLHLDFSRDKTNLYFDQLHLGKSRTDTKDGQINQQDWAGNPEDVLFRVKKVVKHDIRYTLNKSINMKDKVRKLVLKY